MAGQRQGPRKPATKFPQLRKQMQENKQAKINAVGPQTGKKKIKKF
jgi:hypothetical protein